MSNDFWKGYLVASLIALGIQFLFMQGARSDEAIIALIKEEAIKQAVDPRVAISIAEIESSLNPRAIGPKKEIGLFQIRPEYAPVPAIALFNLQTNIRVGIAKIREVYEKCHHKENMTYVICYNNGWRKPRYPYLHPYYKRFITAYNRRAHGG